MADTRKPWSPEEDDAVRAIVKRFGTKRWSAVSQSMLNQYTLSGRTGKQCRERWHNHLDPKINRKPWSETQEKIIFEAHRKYGNRWTDIAQLLQGRTDNSVKNQFYSTIRRSLRRISKALGEKNSTSQMRDIKPSVLSEIFHYAQLPEDEKNSQNEEIVNDCKSLSEALLDFASLKSCTKGSVLLEANREKLESLYEKLMSFKDLSMKGMNKKRRVPDRSKTNLGLLVQQEQSNSVQSNTETLPLKTSSYNKRPIIILTKNVQLIKKKQKKRQQSLHSISISDQSLSYDDQNISSSNKSSIFDWNQWEKKCALVTQFARIADNQLSSNEEDSKLKSQKCRTAIAWSEEKPLESLIKPDIFLSAFTIPGSEPRQHRQDNAVNELFNNVRLARVSNMGGDNDF